LTNQILAYHISEQKFREKEFWGGTMQVDTAVGSIARAAKVLAAMADFPAGASLSDLIARTDFTKTTTHRTLASLQDVYFVTQDPGDKKYRFGHDLAGLARRANLTDLASVAQRSMRRLADLSEDTVFLSIAEGSASICIHRELGAFPIRALTLEVGSRHPLGIGANAQALLSAMPERSRKAANKVNTSWFAEYGLEQQEVEELHRDTIERGYALNPGRIIPGMAAVSLPILTKQGRLVAALAIGAVTDRMTIERIETELVPALRREVGNVSERFDLLEAEGTL
jgi:DNA-binding IclR family transcriptional regulator